MKYRNLGKSGLKVSEISLGSYINFGSKISESDSIKIIKKAYELGVNFFDTADSYAEGKAEQILGRAFRGLKRESFVIATKCFMPRYDYVNARGLSRKNIIESVNQSLKNLNLEYLDLLYCHRFDPDTPLEETVSTLDDLIKAGKILYWGFSRWEREQIAMALEYCDKASKYKPIANQHFYNLLNTQGEDQFEYCKKIGIGVVAYSPLAQGVLTDKYLGGHIPKGSRASDESLKKAMWNLQSSDLDKVKEIKKHADQKGVKLNQYAISWCLENKSISSVIIGTSNLDQLDENLRPFI
jgi:voltage-dependent potassium channel beta subunit